MGELYGEVNKLTLEWKDGLMATIVRGCVKDTTDDHKWIVCDGPVDALWIENMNTCLLYTSPSPRDATLSRMPSSA